MFLIQRWDNVVIDRSLSLDWATTTAEHESTKQPEQRVDIVEHWDDRLDVKVASYLNGQLIPLS